MICEPAREPLRAGRRAPKRAWAVALGLLLSLIPLCVAHADDSLTLDGRWNAGPLTVKWIIGEWGTACGPQPAGGGEPPASVVVHGVGNELTISGGGRTYSTATCWDQYPGIRKIGHASSPRSWRTTCRTPAADARQAAVTTTLTATDDSMSFYEAGQFQFQIQGQNCTASVGRYRTYTIVQRAGTPDAVATDSPPVTKAPVTGLDKKPSKPDAVENTKCATPGPATRLDVRPAKKLLRAGEEFSFRAFVYDAAGCPVYTKPAWAIESGGDHAQMSQPGTVRVNADAPEGEVTVNASVGGRSALVTIEIASSERYDSLLKSGAFNAAGESDDAASVEIASSSIGAASAVAEDAGAHRKRIFVIVVAGVALLLAGLGALVMVRGRRAARTEAARDAARLADHEKRRAARARPGKEAVERTEPASTTARAQPPAREQVAAGVATRPKTVCPMCGQQYAGEAKFCGTDGATLLPLN